MSIARSAREAIANAIDSGEFVLQGSQEELISHEQAILKYADRIITRLKAGIGHSLATTSFKLLRGPLRGARYPNSKIMLITELPQVLPFFAKANVRRLQPSASRGASEGRSYAIKR